MLQWHRGEEATVGELLRWDGFSSSELATWWRERARVASGRGGPSSQTDVVRVRLGTACSGACQPTTLSVRMQLGLVPS